MAMVKVHVSFAHHNVFLKLIKFQTINLTSTYKSLLKEYLEEASVSDMSTKWKDGSWSDWYSGTSKSGLKKQGLFSAYIVHGVYNSGTRLWKVKLQVMSSGADLVTFSSSEDPGTAQDIMTAMHKAVKDAF